MNILDGLFRWEELSAHLSDEACLRCMLDFEAALAHAESAAGVIPNSAASAIAGACKMLQIDLAKIKRDAAQSGNLAIPLLAQLKPAVAALDKEAAGFVHFGATSQDAIDTGAVLRLRDAVKLISAELDKLCSALATLAKQHRATPIIGRTWMQHAVPTTLGAKFAGWLDALSRDRQRLQETARRCLVLQFGGAVGTLATLGTHGPTVTERLAKELQLPYPAIAWHSHRDRMAEIATTLGLLTGTLGKIAGDISLHSQTEIAELFEPSEGGRGGSSTMPHKRNPVACAAILSAATRVPGLVGTMLTAMPQEDERGLGGWHAEWETLPELVCLAGDALHRLAEIIPHLQIDVNRTRTNIQMTGGLVFAEALVSRLAEKIGREEARKVVDAACLLAQTENKHLRAITESDAISRTQLTPADLDDVFNLQSYVEAGARVADDVLSRNNLERSLA